MRSGDHAHASAQPEISKVRVWSGSSGRRFGAGSAHQVSNTARLRLETGADVGQVVGHDVELGLLGIQAGLGNRKRANHGERSGLGRGLPSEVASG
jgi:hypothetical protein